MTRAATGAHRRKETDVHYLSHRLTGDTHPLYRGGGYRIPYQQGTGVTPTGSPIPAAGRGERDAMSFMHDEDLEMAAQLEQLDFDRHTHILPLTDEEQEEIDSLMYEMGTDLDGVEELSDLLSIR